MVPPARPWSQVSEAVDLDREYVVFSSRFYLKSIWRVPRFMLAANRIMKQLDAYTPGVVGWSMAADLGKLEFHTISVWENTEALRRFNASGEHEVALRRFASSMKRRGTFLQYKILGEAVPISWPDAIAYLDRHIASG